MMKHLLTIVLCLTTLTGLAQEEKIKKSEWWNGNPSYAVPIREVNVTARRPMKEIGIQKTQLDTTILHENIALSMADILTFNTSIFVKQYGRATLSTVAFRGTSPSHTQVTWNGMRINSPMLGMTDFSMIPSYFIDDASLLHGTSSVNEAGGGLGGAVKLSTRPADADGFNLQYTQGVGSFSTFDEFLRLTYGNDRWQTSTRVVYSSSPNDFKYRNYDKNVLILDDDHNIFRYYSPKMGMYVSQDPIGLAGNNPTLYGYVQDTNSWIDIFGLSGRGGDVHRNIQNQLEEDLGRLRGSNNVKAEGQIILSNNESRFGDVIVRDPVTGKITEVHQIGDMRSRGGFRPSSRERGAIMDIREALGDDVKIVFHDKKSRVTLINPDKADDWQTPNKRYRKLKGGCH